jgi:hypothetical protein
MLLALGFAFSGAASAQTGYGNFRLSQPVHWGKLLLPAGEYEFALKSPSMTGLVFIHSRDQKTSGFVMPVGIARLDSEAPSALIIEIPRNQRMVRSLRLAERYLVLNFGSEKGRNAIRGGQSGGRNPAAHRKVGSPCRAQVGGDSFQSSTPTGNSVALDFFVGPIPSEPNTAP